jgi:hypothetical protein
VKPAEGPLTQSFVVRGAGRERIAAWFDDHLPQRGWIRIDGVGNDGRLASRRFFTKDQGLLVVAVVSAPVVAQTPPFDEPTSKYSLLLYPRWLSRFAQPVEASGSVGLDA